MLLLLVSFFNPYAGIAGFLATILALSISHYTGLNKASIQKGNYSYNALIIGIGMGAIFNFSLAFWLLLTFIVIFSVILSVVLQHLLGKYGLPFLTIPFVLCFWLVLLVTNVFQAIDFTYRNIYWMNDAYAIGSSFLVKFIMFFDRLDMPVLMSTFFKALSSLYFQNNVLAGIIISIGVLIHSRIIFSLLVIGFITAFAFNNIVMAHPEGMNNYLIGGNFILVSVAIGGFFIVSSFHSYLWAIVSVPITFIIVMALGRITGQWGLPVFSVPFCITVLCILFFLSIKEQKGRVILTPLQLYSPEKNLYNFLNNRERLLYRNHIRLQLPFLGQWMVSQGYEGNITHKGDWSKALDFIIVDNELKTYAGYGQSPQDFYCFNKPVLASADGFVQEVVDYIDDNEIGKINKEQNWGNTIVIKHAEGLYTKMSHLKKNSFRAKVGDYVKKGDIVASCGNSGRSPEPHLHFQVQVTPFIGSKTTAYPFSAYVLECDKAGSLQTNKVPEETSVVNNIIINNALKNAFAFLPGYRLMVKADGYADENWEVFTDAYNQLYIYCEDTKATAYFDVNEAFFYFTAYYGVKESLLYYFYTVAYKIIFTTEQRVTITDKFPLQLNSASLLTWLQDVIAPFYIFSRLHYESNNESSGNDLFNSSISIHSFQSMQFLSVNKKTVQGKIEISDDKIDSFTTTIHNKKVIATCTLKD